MNRELRKKSGRKVDDAKFNKSDLCIKCEENSELVALPSDKLYLTKEVTLTGYIDVKIFWTTFSKGGKDFRRRRELDRPLW